jgi:hypothetical protein
MSNPLTCVSSYPLSADSIALRSRLIVALRTNSSRLARSFWNCDPDGCGGSGSTGGGAGWPVADADPSAGGATGVGAGAGPDAARARSYAARRPSSDRMRYASVSSAARSAASA